MKDLGKAEKKASELQSLMFVINNRLEGMTSINFKLLSIDPVLWLTVAEQLKDASKIALVISKACTDKEK